MNSFGNNLIRLRKQKGATQSDIAQKLNVTRQTVSSWETGRSEPDIDTLVALSDVLGVNTNELLHGKQGFKYPQFQRRYIVLSCISGGLAFLILLFHITLYPYLEMLRNEQYLPYAFHYIYSVPLIGFFAAGIFLPSILSLWAEVTLKKTWKIICTILGLILAIIPFLFILDSIVSFLSPGDGIPFNYTPFLSTSVRRLLFLKVFPFLSGVLTFLGFNKQERQDS